MHTELYTKFVRGAWIQDFNILEKGRVQITANYYCMHA